jgi:hypothetical protein
MRLLGSATACPLAKTIEAGLVARGRPGNVDNLSFDDTGSISPRIINWESKHA